MSTGLPKHFDPERLAAHGSGLVGTLGTDSMPRLRELLASNEPAPVRVELRAQRDEARRLVLAGDAQAELALTCQRCMEPVKLEVNAAFALAVTADEEAARTLPVELDPLLLAPGDEVELAAMIEDELILALPPVPVHASVEDCGERARYGHATDEKFNSGVQRENPFAVLKKLKNGKT